MNLSLDGYIAAPGDDLGWSVPSDELFQRWSDRGRRDWRCTGASCGLELGWNTPEADALRSPASSHTDAWS